ncbi:hypothetical protein [Actinoplanes sp. L3-i22]|uniref:hypothetical protein n=1 Tax=Actinoplanes sp. L3-i22 TaxID=2836373 RepID=UPI001C747022|nr:hypothetical protein [Actinoplanes sp. L3-i22]BCY09339.1 hypothetical protein L3i22_044270 [Actinoplanes sp. L3-i22]
MTSTKVRDDRISQQLQDQYEEAAQQAATRRRGASTGRAREASAVPSKTVRDDRISRPEQADFEEATRQASARQQGSAVDQSPDGDLIRRLDDISDLLRSMSVRVTRLESGDTDTSVSNRPLDATESGSTGIVAGTDRVTGTVAEDFPWFWPFPPPPPPVLTRTQGPDFIDGPNGNAFIDTVANLTQSGQLQATTHVQATNLFGGVTTGTLILVADETGAIIARSGLQQIGVDGTWVPFKESNRTVGWGEDFGTDVANRGRALYVAHFHAGRNRLVEDLNEIFGAVADVAAFVENFCAKNPDLCAAVAAAFA